MADSHLNILHGHPMPDAHEIIDGVYMGGLAQANNLVQSGQGPSARLQAARGVLRLVGRAAGGGGAERQLVARRRCAIRHPVSRARCAAALKSWPRCAAGTSWVTGRMLLRSVRVLRAACSDGWCCVAAHNREHESRKYLTATPVACTYKAL